MNEIRLLYIDLFCGAGGTSTGIEKARLFGKKCAKVVACVNHDANAIASHQANHPGTLHFTEDIRTLELSPLVKHLEKEKTKHPDAHVVLWASLECTNFSNAKGGQPRDALTVIGQRDREETFFFLDPPYPGCVQKHYSGFTFEHFEELLEKLTHIKGKFLLCNFHSDVLQRYVDANGWNMTVKELPMRVANFKGHARRKQEVMVCNYSTEPKLFDDI